MSVLKSSEKARLYPAACGGGVGPLLDGSAIDGPPLDGKLLDGPPPDPHAQRISTNTSDNAVTKQMVMSLLLFFVFILDVDQVANMPKSEAENCA